ncbi:MAG TPA: bifunctional DNA-formamidopyrimidine glycosylase/DNA-(apurinic or apyrimidinic site) lyase [Hyphomicrobiales bacterium]|nr:bifunctional DNA-formamidopyrimidine glycosylase/DNA-(apurinic or apyrimidinic site) lyase [Hyphomicrobiales bacterium]
MPELPEVEIVRRGLAPAMEGASFVSVLLNRAGLRFPFDPGFAERLQNERVHRLTRRAKYIIAETDSGLGLAIHLGMTGRFTIERAAGTTPLTAAMHYYRHDPDPRHDHVIFAMSRGEVIRYNDVRRFGYMTLFPAARIDEHRLFKGLGAEPLSSELTPAYLISRARGKTQPVKNFLLDQRVIGGLGNIYACEALFRAGLPPDAEAGALARGKRGPAAAERLCAAIKGVLEDALLAGGSSIKDYRHADGTVGGFQEKFDVYGREGHACRKDCGGVIERRVQQGRSTFFCPRCQARF